MRKTYQKETKLFEFLQDTNSKVLKIKKNNVSLQWLHFAKTRRSLQWLCSPYIAVYKCFINKDIYFCCRSSLSLMSTKKATSFSMTGYTGKYWPVAKDV